MWWSILTTYQRLHASAFRRTQEAEGMGYLLREVDLSPALIP